MKLYADEVEKLASPNLSPTAKAVALELLALNHERDSLSCISNVDLADGMGLSVRTIERALKELIDDTRTLRRLVDAGDGMWVFVVDTDRFE